MSKLYGPDEGYEVVKSRSPKKTRVNKEKKVSQHASLYSTVRGKISELICDQEPVMSGPPFNPVVDLNILSHEQFVDRASAVITPLNPEGHPPPGVYSPTMKSLIDRLEVSRMTNDKFTVLCISGERQFATIVLIVCSKLQRNSRGCSSSVTATEEVATKEDSQENYQKDESFLRTVGHDEYLGFQE